MKKTGNDWAEVIANATVRRPDVVPDGFLTARQISEQQGIDVKCVQKRVKILIEDGVVEFKKFRIKTFDRGVYPTMHYRITNK